MRSAPAGSSVNAQGLTIVYGIPLSRTKSSPCSKTYQCTKSDSEKEKEKEQKRAEKWFFDTLIIYENIKQLALN